MTTHLESVDLDELFRTAFGPVGAERSRRVINVLLESPFFYRTDDIELFGLLRRHRELFAQFFQVFMKWDLYVDDQMARLIKPRTVNPNLRPSQRHMFRISGRHEYVLFTLLLEYHQIQADEQNLDLDRCDEVRFVLADFVEFAFRRYGEEMGPAAPSEEHILAWMKSLFRKLEQHRFIAVRETAGSVAEEGMSEAFTPEGVGEVLYALLPGLQCYRPDVLTRDDLFPLRPREENRDEQPEVST